MWRTLLRDGLRAARRLDAAACRTSGLLHHNEAAKRHWVNRLGWPLSTPVQLWTNVVRCCADTLLLPATDARAHKDPLSIGLELLCEMNRCEMVYRHAAAFRTAAVLSHDDHCDIHCDSLLTALELGTDDVHARQVETTKHIERLTTRARELREDEEQRLERPSLKVSARERLFLTVNHVLFHETLSVLPHRVADRAALSMGTGLAAGRVRSHFVENTI